MKPLHCIDELILDLSFSATKIARREKKDIESWIVESLLVEVDQLFNQYSNSDQVLRFDQLTIDIGKVSSKNYQSRISEKTLSDLSSIIGDRLSVLALQKSSTSPAAKDVDGLVLTQLLEFLSAGFISHHNPASTQFVHTELFLQVIECLDVAFLLRTLPDSKVVIKRFIQQFSQTDLVKILRQLCSNEFFSVLELIDLIECTDFALIGLIDKKTVTNLFWEQVLLYFITHKENSGSTFLWVKPLLSMFSNSLNLNSNQLLVLINNGCQSGHHNISSNLTRHIFSDFSVETTVNSYGLQSVPLNTIVNENLNVLSLQADFSILTTRQIDFLMVYAFESKNLDFIFSNWQKLKINYSSIVTKSIAHFMGNIVYRKWLISELPEAYLVDFIFLLKPGLSQFIVAINNNAENLLKTLANGENAPALSIVSLTEWKSICWENCFNVLLSQKYSQLDLKKYWKYFIDEFSMSKNTVFPSIESQWIKILGNEFKGVRDQQSVHAKSIIFYNKNKIPDVKKASKSVANETLSILTDYTNLKLLNQQQVHQLLSHAMAGMNINFLIVHWHTLKQSFPEVFSNNLRHYLAKIEFRQDIIICLPEALLLDLMGFLNADIYPTVSAVIVNAELLYRVSIETNLYSNKTGSGPIKRSFLEWKSDIWHICFALLFDGVHVLHNPSFLLHHLLDLLSVIYHFEIQAAIPQWHSVCDVQLSDMDFSEYAVAKPYSTEFILLERYIFNFERSQKKLSVLLVDLSANQLNIDRFFYKLERNYTSLLSVQLTVDDWSILIKFYVTEVRKENSAYLAAILKSKVNQQRYPVDYCYQLFCRLLKSDKDRHKDIIENYNLISKDEFFKDSFSTNTLEAISDDRLILKQEDAIGDVLPSNYLAENEYFSIERSIANEFNFDEKHISFEQSDNKTLLSLLVGGNTPLSTLNLSSSRLMNMVVELIEASSEYLTSFKIDLLASIHSQANQVSDLHSFYMKVLQSLLARENLDLELIVSQINATDTSRVQMLPVKKSSSKESSSKEPPVKEVPIEELTASEVNEPGSIKNKYKVDDKNLLHISEQLKNKSIDLEQISENDTDFLRLLVVYLENDESIIKSFREDILISVENYASLTLDKNFYYRKVIEALIKKEVIDLEAFAVPEAFPGDAPKQSLSKNMKQSEPHNIISIDSASEKNINDNNPMRNINHKSSLQQLKSLLLDQNELSSNEILLLQKIINGVKDWKFTDEEWLALFSDKKLAEKFLSYVPGYVLHQLFLRLRPQSYQTLNELMRLVLGVLTLLVSNVNSNKIQQAQWFCIVELIFESTNNLDKKFLLEKIAFQMGKAAGIEDLQRLLNLVQRRHFSVSSDKSKQVQLSKEKIVEIIKASTDVNALEAGLHLNNVGLVLVAPYLPRLFSMLELVKNGEFVHLNAADRAVHLLQYIVTGKTQTVEYELVLNKILCGISTSIPISSGIEITEQEKLIIDQMLNSIIQHWSVLGSTSISGLRETFFQRQGWLRLEDDAWHMDVKEGTFDMLIDHIPWSFSLIKYGWMDKPLHVKWRNKD